MRRPAFSSRFLRERRGNFALGAALLAVPLVFAAGAGLDASRVWSAKAKLQNAVDSAALAVMKDAAFKPVEAERVARRMVTANFGEAFDALAVSFSEFGATVSAETRVELTLTRVLGFETMDAAVSGTAEYPPTKYEIALVLDTTGSMAGTKLSEMKKGALRMMDELTATEMLRRRVKFSIVPFSSFVNVGANKAGTGWIDGQGVVEAPNNMIPAGVSRLKMFGSLHQPWKGCVEMRVEPAGTRYGMDDTAPDRDTPETLFVPLYAPDEPSPSKGSPYRYANDFVFDSSLKGLGVVIGPNGVVSYLQAVVSTLFGGSLVSSGGPNAGCNVQPILELTADTAAMRREVSALRASGNTNIAEGVAWGNRVLSPGEPFAEGASYDADVQKIMVLLTDGDNTVAMSNNPNLSSYSAFGYVADGRWDRSAAAGSEPVGCYLDPGEVDPNTRTHRSSGARVVKDKNQRWRRDRSDRAPVNCIARPADLPMPAGRDRPSEAKVAAAMNERTVEACDATKAKGVEVFTIRLEVNTATSSALLQTCASDASHYYDVTDAAELQAIFDDIANRIKPLRISS